MSEFLLVDVSNTFTKITHAGRRRCGRSMRVPTRDFKASVLRKILAEKPARHLVAASVVPDRNREIEEAFDGPICWVGPKAKLGIGIDYPKPSRIGADRLANAAGCVALYGAPAIVVDFGTAVTFDVVSKDGDYVGGVIAPGLNSMADYLHSRTALLPLISLREPRGAVGRSTKEAMLSGAVHGYRGMVAEIIKQIRQEAFPKRKPRIVATGGDAVLISKGLPIFDVIDPHLTMEGLRVIGGLNFPE